MVNNRFLGSIANAIDSAAVGTYLAKRAGGPVFEPLNYGDLADYPAVGIDSAGVLSLIDSSYLSARSSSLGTDIDSEVSTSGINNLIPDSSGVRSIGNYSKGISNIFLDSSSEIKIGSHSISISSEYILFDGGTAASFPAASSGPTANAWDGDRGLIAGGLTSAGYDRSIDYVNITSPGNAADFGDLTAYSSVGKMGFQGVSNQTRGVFCGGYKSAPINVIDYVTVATLGNAIDFGDMVGPANGCGGQSDGTYAVIAAGGRVGANASEEGSNAIDYFTIASTGNASDFGDLTVARHKHVCGVGNGTRVIFGGGMGNDGGNDNQNVIDYVTAATPGNATDFGDLINAVWGGASANDATRGIYAGGSGGGANMEYITMDTTGNGTDFGDLTTSRYNFCGVGHATYAIFGGNNGSSPTSIDYVTVQTAGNAADFGDMTDYREGPGGTSGSAA